MDTRTSTNEKNGLTVVTRELLGRDRITDSYVRAELADRIGPRYGFKTAKDVTMGLYSPITDVASIIVQTVSLEGDWPESIVLPSHNDYKACVEFFDALMELPDWYMQFLLDSVAKVNAALPNPTGGQTVPPSTSESSPALGLAETTV